MSTPEPQIKFPDVPPIDFFVEELSDQAKAIRNQYVNEYMKDFNAFDACIRIGFQPSFAREYAQKWMSEPYVLQEIAKRKITAPKTGDDLIVEDKALIEHTLRQAMQHGPYASRVGAAKTLAGIHGIDQAPDQSGKRISEMVDAFKAIATKVE